MATVVRIAPTTLSVGQSVSGSWTPTGDVSNIAITSIQVGADTSQVRIIARDSRGLTLASDILVGTDANRLEPIEGLSGDVTVEVVCMLGTAVVGVAELTGATAFGMTIVTADIADDAVTEPKIGPGAVDVNGLAAGALAATAPGRAKFADDFWTAAEFAAGAGGKFAPNCLVSAGIQNLFAAASMDGAACAHLFPAAAIPIAAVAAAPLAIETVIADPGAAANIVVTGSGHCNINIAAPADDRGLPIPTIDGQAILIVHTAGANAGTVTSAQALDSAGTTVLNFDANLGQWILLIGRSNGAALRWVVAAQGGVVTHTPVYEPIAFADPGNGNQIPVTDSGRCVITIAGAGDTRLLANPLFVGQELTIESLAASASGMVVCANAFNEAGAVNLHFLGGINEQVRLRGYMVVGALRWRVVDDGALTHVSRTIPDPGNAGNIEVLHDDANMEMNILGGGHNRALPNPTYAGQKLTIIHTDGANAGTVTSASDITDVGGENVINFTAALGEMISLEAVNIVGTGLRWRIRYNPDGLVIN